MPYKIGTPHNSLKASMVPAMAFCISLCLFFYPSQGLSQSRPTPPNNQKKSPSIEAGAIQLEQLRAKRKTIESSEDLGDLVKKNVLSFLDQAIRFRESAAQFEREAEDTEKKTKSVSKRIREIEAMP